MAYHDGGNTARVKDAVGSGARVTTGWKRHAPRGTFFEPTVLVDVNSGRRVADAVRLANGSDLGLAANFFSRDLGRAWRVAEAIEAGMIGVNTGLISIALAPFGGVKQSGMGREGSRYGIEDYSFNHFRTHRELRTNQSFVTSNR